ncbi:MAG: helix-turn-helix transcriptional regulator [Chloroflexi bacterium]|nr:helix-turn-helix transcriptional regulator [Chloroflexota bacterium]
MLTERQQAILVYVAQGATNKQIGEHLHISENTVKYHQTDNGAPTLATRHELVLSII